MIFAEINLSSLEIAKFYLFGDVKILHFLLLAMGLDIITGLFKAFKEQDLFSRTALYGFASKILILIVIVLSNILDQILHLGGMLPLATVVFYTLNEGLSIIENVSVYGVLVPQAIKNYIKQAQEDENIKVEVFDGVINKGKSKRVEIKVKNEEGSNTNGEQE